VGLWPAAVDPNTEARLRAGQLVFSGGVTAPVPVVAGGSVTFEFDALGALEVYGA
jgi:2-oxo-3-hexenedioate decarboxylase